jgi:uncharacterized protein (DUF1778 family)
MEEPRRDERLDVRISTEHKALITRAAAVSGQPVSAFAIAAMVQRARIVLAEHEHTVLSARDREAFLEALDDDQPSDRLREAAGRFMDRRD